MRALSTCHPDGGPQPRRGSLLQVASGKKKGREKNPISDERKRMAFVVVADVSSKMSYNTV